MMPLEKLLERDRCFDGFCRFSSGTKRRARDRASGVENGVGKRQQEKDVSCPNPPMIIMTRQTHTLSYRYIKTVSK